MFGFLFARKRNEVIRFMQRRMNRSRMQQVSVGQRGRSREAYCQVVWVIPCDEQLERPDFCAAFPAVTRDISAEGLSFIHTVPVSSESVLVGLHDETGSIFVLCSVEHCTPLGYGFYQIGVNPEEIINPDGRDVKEFQKHVQRFDEQPTAADALACG